MEVFGYRELIVYLIAKDVVKQTYGLLKKFPIEERYALCDQLRRVSLSHRILHLNHKTLKSYDSN